MRDERRLPTVSPHRLVGRKVTTSGGKTGVGPLNRPETREASRGEAKIVSGNPALPLSVEIAERGTTQRARLASAMEVDPPRPGASATITSCSGTDGLNEPVPGKAALEAAI